MGVLTVVIILLSLLYAFGAISAGISAKIWRGWTLKKSTLAAPPLALIVVIELISPSIRLTGYIPPPKPITPQWQTQKTVWTDVPLTWADVNHHLFGTAPDGYLPKEMLQAQLEQRRLELATKHESTLRMGTLSSGLSDFYERRNTALKLQLNALNTSIENLDALYTNGPVTPQEFRLWQAKIVEDIAILERDRTENLNRTAIKKFATWSRSNPEATNDNPTQAKLEREYYYTRSAYRAAVKDLESIRTQQATFAKRVEFARPSDRFLPPPWPLELASAKNNARTSDLRSDILKGPNATTGMLEWLVRAFKAFDNDTRMSANIPSSIKCYISITGQTGALQKDEVCEIHTPVLINFDLTIADCTPSETASCTERWVLPDLTILLRDNSVTFLPPRPTTPAMRPASRWEIFINGEAKPLKGATTFDLAADQLYRLPVYVLSQLPTDTDGEIRIWKDFETASFLSDKAALRSDRGLHAAHAFAGHTVETSIDVELPLPSNKIIRILHRYGQGTKNQKHPFLDGLIYNYLASPNVRSSAVSLNSSGCFQSKKPNLHYGLLESILFPHLTPNVLSWITEPTLTPERCRRANTLTALYEGLWPTDPIQDSYR